MASIFTKIAPQLFAFTRLTIGNSKTLLQTTLTKPILPSITASQIKWISATTNQGIQHNVSPLQLKKRPVRKKPISDMIQAKPGMFSVVAYTTAEEYNLEHLVKGLAEEDLYATKNTDLFVDVVHAVAKYQVDQEPRELFFFREGSIVMWNISDLEASNVLKFVKKYEQDSYSNALVQGESEIMSYKYNNNGKSSSLQANGEIILKTGETITLDKYTFSNAMALSVKLGLWEASLDKYIDSIEFVTEDLKMGRKIKMTQEEVLRKHGELFALRHVINLSSDLLDTPDFYWDREELEALYNQTCGYFSIARRTRVMNEKINHCVELVELLSSHLSDRHHVRLEWMIIILIMVEVAFETIHYMDRYLS